MSNRKERPTRLTIVVVWSALITTLSVSAVPAQQQPGGPGLREVQPEQRHGGWLGVGLGLGREAFDLKGDGKGYSSYLDAPTFYLNAGGTVAGSVELGAEALFWVDDERFADQVIGSLMFIANWYPIPRAGLYLKGGVGLARSEFEFPDGTNQGDTGFGGILSVGYELPVARRVAIVPSVSILQHTFNGRSYVGYHERIINFGVGAVFHLRARGEH